MKNVFFIFIFAILGCSESEDMVFCLENVSTIETYSVGYPNMLFPVNQNEVDTRQGISKSLTRLEIDTVVGILKSMTKEQGERKDATDILGVVDIYCGKRRFVIYSDRIHIYMDGYKYQTSLDFQDILFDYRGRTDSPMSNGSPLPEL